MKEAIGWRLARWLYAAFYLYNGILMSVTLMGFLPRPDFHLTGEAKAFADAMAATGFLEPALAITYILSGLALFWRRTAPLGVILLAPVMVVIFLDNLLLTGAWLWGTVHLLWLLALAWRFRTAFRPLWSYAPA